MSSFYFKKFTIHQKNAPLRITSDACIFGAWISIQNAQKILDIGTGTGILALMLAQRSQAQIDALEINKKAFLQAQENFSQSIYQQQICAIQGSIQEYAQKNNLPYDLIVCNPPFFQNSLVSDNLDKNIAKHTEKLTFDDLTQCVSNLLHPEGRFAVLLPVQEAEILKQKFAKFKLFPHQIVQLRHSENHPFHRIMTIYKFDNQEVTTEILDIKTPDGKSDSWKLIALMKHYYLYL